MIWTFKQERNCCTISVCYSGCEMTPRRDSFARRQPPIQPVLDASFLLMQRSGTHALCVKLTGSHLPVLPVLLRAYCIVYGGKNQAEINIFLLIPAIFSCLSRNVENAASNLLSIIQRSVEAVFDEPPAAPAMERAACYGTTDLQIIAFELLR